MMMEYRYIQTPLGSMIAVTCDQFLITLDFVDQVPVKMTETMNRVDQKHDILDKVQQQLQEYFLGKRRNFTVPLHGKGTEFQQKVWQAVCNVGYGDQVAYQDIARTIDHDKAVRAVGLANGKNPLLIIVPCHRVVRLNGEMGGYAAGLDRKKWLLQHEALHKD